MESLKPKQVTGLAVGNGDFFFFVLQKTPEGVLIIPLNFKWSQIITDRILKFFDIPERLKND